MDELISAQKHPDLLSLLAELDGRHSNAAGYTFLNNFFFPNEEADLDFASLPLPFDMFHASKRLGPYHNMERTKVIAKTDRTVQIITHFIEEVRSQVEAQD